MDDGAVERFIERWKGSAAAEKSNFQPFTGDLCDLLGVPRPDPSVQDDDRNRYVAGAFRNARRDKVKELLETLVSIGQARMTDEGRYSAR